MKPYPIVRLAELGQSVWLDYIDRKVIASGELERLIEQDGLRGMTSNPTIFQKAVAGSDLYDLDLAQHRGAAPAELAEAIMVADVQRACDVFRPLYDALDGKDGLVSIECPPSAAYDTDRSIAAARRLWSAVDRPNVMVKIPGTSAGIPAIRQCLAEGIHINITLLFSVEGYMEVMEAYLDALELRVSRGEPVQRLRSVASFFVSRVGTKVDKLLAAIVAEDGPSAERARALQSKVAIANAKLAYERFRSVFRGPRWAKLERAGAALQRPLWASTSTKNPTLPKTYYIEALVGPDTVDTMPPETLAAYKEHGDPAVRITDDVDEAHATLDALMRLGIDLRTVTAELEAEGVASFAASYDALVEEVRGRSAILRVA